MKKELDILLVEDNEGDVRIIKELLKEQSYIDFNITLAGNLKDAINILSKFTFDTILLDLGLPDSIGIETFMTLHRSFPNLATTIILTGLNDTEIGLKAVNKGAQDFIIKGQVDSEKLVKSIIYSYERNNLNTQLKLQLEAKRVAEEDLRVTLVKYKTLFDCLPLGITVSDEKGSIVETNVMAQKLLNLTNDEQIQRDIDGLDWIIVRPDGTPMPPEEFASVRALKNRCEVENVEMGIVKSRNLITWINVSAIPLPLKGYGVVIVYSDISKRKLAEEALIILNEDLEHRVIMRTKQLEAANIELESFSYSVSHDLRAPLRHINGFTEILKNDYQEILPKEAQHHLDSIIDSALNMNALIDDLLNLSRTSRVELKKSAFMMHKAIDDAFSTINPSMTNRKVDLKMSSLPEVNGDYNLIRLVWVNLLDNAIKYSRTRKKTLIHIECKEEKEELIFCIRDNGVGFDMNYAQKLFGVFQRLHTRSEFEGTGIGLANVRRIISRHGGRTWAESELGKGASFYFTLPILKMK